MKSIIVFAIVAIGVSIWVFWGGNRATESITKTVDADKMSYSVSLSQIERDEMKKAE